MPKRPKLNPDHRKPIQTDAYQSHTATGARNGALPHAKRSKMRPGRCYTSETPARSSGSLDSKGFQGTVTVLPDYHGLARWGGGPFGLQNAAKWLIFQERRRNPKSTQGFTKVASQSVWWHPHWGAACGRPPEGARGHNCQACPLESFWPNPPKPIQTHPNSPKLGPK